MASFTHLLHGFVFCGLVAWTFPRVPPVRWLWMAGSIGAVWKIVENSEFVIRRYRGDTFVNSMGDMVARRLGLRRALAVFVLLEAALALCVRDGPMLNVPKLI